MNLIAERDSKGNVFSGNVKAKIPTNQSMISIMGLNGIIDNGDYREDGMVYINNKPVKKWHINIDRVRIWEPKLKDLPSLYELYKKTQIQDNLTWKKIRDILIKVWGNHKSGYTVKVHALPTHEFTWSKPTEPWWEYSITNDYRFGLSFSFNWLDEKPKKLNYPDEGKELYYLDIIRRESTGTRHHKVRAIFFEAICRSLPKASGYNVIMLQFKDDFFVFRTVYDNGIYYWLMFEEQYKLETKRIV